MCRFCDIQNLDDDLFDQQEVNRIVAAIYAGSITVRSLDLQTYLKVARKLSDGVYKGFNMDLDHVLYLSEDYKMLYALRNNVYVFSAAKQYQQVRHMSSLLTKVVDGKKKITPFNEFRKGATEVFKEYNVNYLRAEYNSAQAQAKSASQWKDFERDKSVLPYLKYVTAHDGRVRPEHAMLEGITRKVDDPFWDKFMPPNGWNCRCDVQQSDEGKETDLSNFTTPSTVPDIFQFNPGKEKIVFSNKHPYYDVAPKDKALAKNNFNLPLPKDGV